MKTTGLSILKDFIASAPTKPGVYRMISENDTVLYVGKAKNIRNRLLSYTHLDQLPVRLGKMVMSIARMEVIETRTEAEALLLESDLIKKLSPRYNILLTDDKSFPYIAFSKHPFPRLYKHRGRMQKDSVYFGPFASIKAANETLKILQDIFMIRTCSDSFFNNRIRPCMLHQIKKCSAPCCHKISQEDYQLSYNKSLNFLKGKSMDIIHDLSEQMKSAAIDQKYELAALYRDKIQFLNTVYTQTRLNEFEGEHTDVIGIYSDGQRTCIQIFFFKDGYNCGNTAFYPKHTEGHSVDEILRAFLFQFYQRHPAPPKIYLSHSIDESETQLFEESFSTKIIIPQRGDKKSYLQSVVRNAEQSLSRHQDDINAEVFDQLRDLLSLDVEKISRIDVFDNSHLQGTNPVGGMIVAGRDQGFRKNDYRKYNLAINTGNDLEMMREVMRRRYSRAKTENSLPDIILLDGGRTQLTIGKEVLAELDLTDKVFLASIAKGENRNAGGETIYTTNGEVLKLDKTDPILFLLECLRDEAHRYVISFQRSRRQSKNFISALDEIEGIGPTKKKALLHAFGSVKNITDARVEDLLKVSGINRQLAQKIYDILH